MGDLRLHDTFLSSTPEIDSNHDTNTKDENNFVYGDRKYKLAVLQQSTCERSPL